MAKIRGRKFVVYGEEYNATTLAAEVARIKSRLSYGESITRGDRDFEFMASLYDLFYPKRFDSKDKPDGSYMVMDLTVLPNRKCDYQSLTFFWVMPDGDLVNWQPTDCWKPQTHVSLVRDAFRWAVKDQVYEKLTTMVRVLDGQPMDCPITGKSFDPSVKGQADVDHEPPEFRDIFVEFISCRGLELNEIEVTRDNGTFLVDKALEADFQDYHRRSARLRVVSKEGHKMKTYKWIGTAS
jgi:hypothetical protein